MSMMHAPMDLRRLNRWAANRGLRYGQGSDNGYVLHMLLAEMFGPQGGAAVPADGQRAVSPRKPVRVQRTRRRRTPEGGRAVRKRLTPCA